MSDRLLGAACMAIAAAMAWSAQGYVAPIAYEPVGPRAFPWLLSALMGAGGLWLVLRPGPSAAASGQPLPLKGLALAVVAVFSYAALFQWLGFPLATLAMALPVGLAFGGRAWPVALGGLGLGLVGFLLFDKTLDVVLPTGWLAFLLGGR